MKVSLQFLIVCFVLQHGLMVAMENIAKFFPSGELAILNSSQTDKKSTRMTDDPVLEAIKQGKLEEVQELLESGQNIDGLYQAYNDKDQVLIKLPLQAAFDYKQYAIALFLIEKGANIHTRDLASNTSLHRAALSSDESLITLLVNKGAEINAQNSTEQTPLSICLENNYSMARYLISQGADILIPRKSSSLEQIKQSNFSFEQKKELLSIALAQAKKSEKYPKDKLERLVRECKEGAVSGFFKSYK